MANVRFPGGLEVLRNVFLCVRMPVLFSEREPTCGWR